MNKWNKYEWLLFDLDNTLLDFSNTSKKAFISAFEQLGRAVTNQDYDNYNSINAKYWHYYEQHKVSADELRVNRFKEFITKVNWQHDANQLSNMYLNYLVTHSHWVDGAEQLWNNTQHTFKKAIVTNGLSKVQQLRTSKHEIDSPLFISEDIGVSKPNPDFFEHVHQAIGAPAKNTVLVIGDNPIADIKGAAKFGFDTCFFNYKNLKKLPKEATMVVGSW